MAVTYPGRKAFAGPRCVIKANVPKALRAALDAQAKALRQDRADLMREALTDWLERRERAE